MDVLPLSWVLLYSCAILALHALQVGTTAVDVLKLGSSLTPVSQPLVSASSTFTLSFRSAPNLDPPAVKASSSSSRLFLAISFLVNSSLNYPVWVANRDTSASSSASLTLSSSGVLLLSDPSASSPLLWKSNSAGLGVVRAQLLDSGNLVLLNSRSEHVWQSFHHPTDTLLPGQEFTANSTALTSNKKSGEFRSGRYFFSFNSQAGAPDQQPSYPVGDFNGLQFDHLGNITFYNSTASSNVVSNDYGVSAMRRMTLDVDGNLRLYTWDVDAAQWYGVWILLLDVCTQVPGVCGSYGVCTYSPTEPTCVCPQGFSVVDPTDLSAGCAARYKVRDYCKARVKFLETENVDFPFNDYLSISGLSIEECKEECSDSCECLAAVYTQSEGICWLKQKVENGHVEMSQRSRVFLKVSMSEPLVSSLIVDTATQWSSQYLWQSSALIQTHVSYVKKSKYSHTVIAMVILVAIQGTCFAATIAGFATLFRRQLKLAHLCEEFEGRPLAYSYEELRNATENFGHKLGEGGFGMVYKGQLQNGKCIAVKQLNEGMLQQEKQFRAEIMTIGRIHHMNLLRLVGFCSEGSHRLLVYEHMEKGSLDQVLFTGRDKAGQIDILDWSTRFSICLGVARGIHYLHEECLNCILHCDIKPQNILLDRRYCAKVADFGLAYAHSRNHTVQMTTIRGTRGYLAPEWVSKLPITPKADVFSYGMLIMEIVSGRSNFLYSESPSVEVGEEWCFPMWAYGKRVEEVVDARLRESSIDWKQVDMVLKVAYACIQTDMNTRPTMRQVLQMLEGTLPLPDAPPPSLMIMPSTQAFSVTKRGINDH